MPVISEVIARGQRAAAVGVVAEAGRHQQRAEVGVADAELAVVAGGVADRLGREVGEADRDVHRGDDQLDGLRRTSRASKVSSSLRNFSRFSEARLHEELSSDMYSEHGLDAVIRPVSGLVCQSLIVSSYWMPGSAHSHAASAILRNSSRASTVSMTSPVVAGAQPELGALLDRAHELVGDPDRVVGVLVLHAR